MVAPEVMARRAAEKAATMADLTDLMAKIAARGTIDAWEADASTKPSAMRSVAITNSSISKSRLQ